MSYLTSWQGVAGFWKLRQERRLEWPRWNLLPMKFARAKELWLQRVRAGRKRFDMMNKIKQMFDPGKSFESFPSIWPHLASWK